MAMNPNRAPVAVAVQIWLYTRPSAVVLPINGVEVVKHRAISGPFARGLFDEDEGLRLLASGLWVDSPVKLSTLDKAIAEATQKEAEADAQRQADEEAERQKKLQDKVVVEAPVTLPTASEPEPAQVAAEQQNVAESAAEGQEPVEKEEVTEQPEETADNTDGSTQQQDQKPDEAVKAGPEEGAKVPTAAKKAKK